MNPYGALKLVAILDRTDHEAFEASATFARYAAEGVDVTLIEASPEAAGTDQVICALVAQLRRVRPQVVITSGPWDASANCGRASASQLATAAVMRAADPRYGHTCCSRGAHSVSKVYYTAVNGPVTTHIESDCFYRLFSTVNTDSAPESDLFEALQQPSRRYDVAA